MNFDNYTIQSQEAIQQAVQIASGNENQAIENGHILKAILEVDKNVVPFIFKKIGQGIILMSTIVCAWIQSMTPSLSNECM